MKYKLTDNKIEKSGITLYQIECVTAFKNISIGEKGGYIEKPENLSQDGDAWVYGDAKIYGNAWVYGNAEIYGNAWVYGNAEVCGNARVCGDATVCGDARVCGNATVCGGAWVYGNAWVYGDAWVYGNAEVCGNAKVCGNAEVCGNAWVYGNAWVCGDAKVCGDADIIWISKIGSNLGTTTVFKIKNGNIGISCGCFYGALEEFEARVKDTHQENKFSKEYQTLINLIKIHFDIGG